MADVLYALYLAWLVYMSVRGFQAFFGFVPADQRWTTWEAYLEKEKRLANK